jgi:DUF438 domain-containing protein
MVTLAELATAMNVPWLEFLREVRGEVQRVSGSAPAIAEDVAGRASDPRLEGELRAVLREFERGAPLADLAARLDAFTEGLDAEEVAVLARGADLAGEGAHLAEEGADQGATLAAGQSADWPAGRFALDPGHPARALLDEGARVRDLASHVEELVDGVTGPAGTDRWPQARSALQGLLARLSELERQARRLRRAWYATLSSRGAHAVTALVDADLSAAVDAVIRARVTAEKGDLESTAAASRFAIGLVRGALAAEEQLFVPSALRLLDDDDWEAVAEQERAVGWALARDQTV